jgi:hypothetical protein
MKGGGEANNIKNKNINDTNFSENGLFDIGKE